MEVRGETHLDGDTPRSREGSGLGMGLRIREEALGSRGRGGAPRVWREEKDAQGLKGGTLEQSTPVSELRHPRILSGDSQFADGGRVPGWTAVGRGPHHPEPSRRGSALRVIAPRERREREPAVSQCFSAGSCHRILAPEEVLGTPCQGGPRFP